ncbi:MAG TPA: signal peptidase I, partial [Bryobacteraceae bacterium]|nr:signal peptidase I [Bryobacteraceae bacterium]
MEPVQDPVDSPVPPPARLASRPPSSLGPVSLLRDVAISVALAVILIVFIYQPVKVEGTSMMPGLTDQERIFVNKYEYKLGENNIHRGDLVVFHPPRALGE